MNPITPPPTSRPRVTRSLRVSILGAFTVLILLSLLAVVTYSYRAHSKALVGLSQDLVTQVSEWVIEKTGEHVRPAALASELTAGLVESTGGRILDNPELEGFCLRLLASFPQLAMLNLGDERGNFLMFKRMDHGGIATKEIRREGATSQVIWTHRDPRGRVQRREVTRGAAYDPRTRPWYEAAMASGGLHWSEPYIFFTDKRPGVTAAVPFRGPAGELEGVVSADIELDELGRFLSELRIGRTGVAFVLDASGKVVAFPDRTKMVVRSHGDDLHLVTVPELGEPTLATAFERYRATRQPRFSLVTGGVRYMVSFTRFPHGFGRDWTIGVVVPEDDFIGTVTQVNRASLVIALVVLMLAVLVALFISREISRPIEELTHEADRIRRLELDGEITISSSIKEIHRMVRAMESMKAGLRSFEKYVPRSLVQHLVRSGREARIGGEKRELTIFFSDVANFTTIAEGLEPEVLARHLSEYLDAVTRVIMGHRGTVDKYMGDGIMAFWGAPVEDPDHPAAACRAALECRATIEDLNRAWASAGLPELTTRIGVNTGTVIVGNMGSAERMNYTVIGDDVNLAARLEGTNKLYGTGIIISHSTWERVHDLFVTRPLDVVAVKGRSQAIGIHELVGLPGMEGEEFFEAFARAFELYLDRRFREALDVFEELHRASPGDEPTALYVRRCRELVDDPPPPDWTGATQLHIK